MRRARAAGVASLVAAALVLGGWLVGSGSGQASGGPVVVMGVDAEDGGIGAHGPVPVYTTLISNVLAQVTNGGANILVVGAGKFLLDDVTLFWTAVDAGLPSATMTFVNGAANIAAQPFGGFAMIAVVSSETQTPIGGLTAPENAALTARAADVATFVNNGGAVVGFTQAGFPEPYLYLGDVGAVGGNFGLNYSDIEPTPAGLAIGVTDDLDVCCWHDEFTTFPSFLEVLATNAETGNAAALGGSNVVIQPPTEPTTTTTPLPPTPLPLPIPGQPTFTG